MSNTFNNTRKNIKKIDSAFSRLETDNNNLELEKHDSDKDYKVFNKLNEAIEFAKNNIKVTFTRKETDEAPKELQQDGENPSVDYVIKRFWGISSKNPARLIPTNDNKWVVYWRPSLIQNKQNTKLNSKIEDEENVKQIRLPKLNYYKQNMYKISVKSPLFLNILQKNFAKTNIQNGDVIKYIDENRGIVKFIWYDNAVYELYMDFEHARIKEEK